MSNSLAVRYNSTRAMLLGLRFRRRRHLLAVHGQTGVLLLHNCRNHQVAYPLPWLIAHSLFHDAVRQLLDSTDDTVLEPSVGPTIQVAN